MKFSSIQHRDMQHGNVSNYDTSQNCDTKDTRCEIIFSSVITNLTTSPTMEFHKTVIQKSQLKVKISSSVKPSLAIFPTMTPHKTAILKTLDVKLSSGVITNLTTSPTIAFHKTVIQKSQLKVKISSSVIPSLAVFPTMTPHKTAILKTLDVKFIQRRDIQHDNFPNQGTKLWYERHYYNNPAGWYTMWQLFQVWHFTKLWYKIHYQTVKFQRRDTQLGNLSNHDTSQNCDIKDTSGTKNIQLRDNQLDNLPNNGNSINCDIRYTTKCENI